MWKCEGWWKAQMGEPWRGNRCLDTDASVHEGRCPWGQSNLSTCPVTKVYISPPVFLCSTFLGKRTACRVTWGWQWITTWGFSSGLEKQWPEEKFAPAYTPSQPTFCEEVSNLPLIVVLLVWLISYCSGPRDAIWGVRYRELDSVTPLNYSTEPIGWSWISHQAAM